MKQPSAVLRALVWAGLAAFAVYSGIKLAAGPGRDKVFADVSWTASAVIQVLVLTAAIAFACGRAAYVTYRREVEPRPGVVRFPGGKMPVFGEAFTALFGGVLLLAAVYMGLRIPESILVGANEQYANYARVSIAPNLAVTILFGGVGFVLMIGARYVWEVVPGRGLVRYWARAFARARPVNELRLYWMLAHRKSNHALIPTEWWLRAKDPTSAGLFRDAFLETAPLDTPLAELDARSEGWRQRLVQLTEGRVAIAVESRPAIIEAGDRVPSSGSYS